MSKRKCRLFKYYDDGEITPPPASSIPPTSTGHPRTRSRRGRARRNQCGGVGGGSAARHRVTPLGPAGARNDREKITGHLWDSSASGDKCQSFGVAVYLGTRRPLQTSIVPCLHDGSSTRTPTRPALQLKSPTGPSKPRKAADETLTPGREGDAERWRLKRETRRALSPVPLAPGSHSTRTYRL